jgi:hypothetical protein
MRAIRLFAFVTLIAASLLIAGTASVSVGAGTGSDRATSVAVEYVHDHGVGARAAVTFAMGQIRAAQATVDSSRGRTLDSTAQAQLDEAIIQWQVKVSAVIAAFPQADPASSPASNAVLLRIDGVAAAKANISPQYDYDELFVADAALKTPEDAVTAAVQAWTVEQSRITALRSAISYTEYVWASGWQAQIDACQGAVDLTAHYGVRTIAEHDNCGGNSFPTTAGTIVRITGVDAGVYRVDGVAAYLNGHTATTADLPRGYDLLFQTCVNGYSSMSFTALTRVGS